MLWELLLILPFLCFFSAAGYGVVPTVVPLTSVVT